MREKRGDVETDSASADDGDRLAGLLCARQQLRVSNDARVIDSRDIRHARGHSARDDEGVESIGDLRSVRVCVEPQFHAGELDTPSKVAQRVVEIFLAGHFPRVSELATDFVRAFEQRDAMAAFGERGGAGKTGGTRTDNRHALRVADRLDQQLRLVSRARIHKAGRALAFEYLVETALVAGDAGVD